VGGVRVDSRFIRGRHEFFLIQLVGGRGWFGCGVRVNSRFIRRRQTSFVLASGVFGLVGGVAELDGDEERTKPNERKITEFGFWVASRRTTGFCVS